MSKLNKCPFCKHENIRLIEHDTLGFAWTCDHCGARTNWYASKSAATRAWNKSKNNTIYTVTLCQHMREQKGWPDLGSIRTIGFYLDEKDAVSDIFMNAGDMFELYYRYAIIEKINEGVYGTDYNYRMRVFKATYTNGINGLVIEELKEIPKVLKNTTGISMG